MISAIKDFLAAQQSQDEQPSEKTIQLASAALLIEVMTIDGQLNDKEELVIRRLLQERFELISSDIDELFRLAAEEVKEATSLYQFTSVVNQHFEHADKQRLVTNLWQVAFADDYLDKHEEGIIRRIAELLHVPHSQYIQAKQRAKQSPK